jgi:hypothetical protein
MTSPDNTTATRRAFIVGVGTAAVPAAASMPVAAEHNPPPQGIFGDGVTASDFSAFFSGIGSGYSSGFSAPESAETLAERAINEFEANEAAWIDYGDWAAQEHDLTPLGDATIAVDFAITRGRWPTRNNHVATTLDTQFDTDSNTYTSVDWRLEEADSPDYEAVLKNQAAENAADELTNFRREFIGDPDADDPDHQLPSDEYISKMTGRYWSAIRVGEDTEHVLQLLLGEFDG